MAYSFASNAFASNAFASYALAGGGETASTAAVGRSVTISLSVYRQLRPVWLRKKKQERRKEIEIPMPAPAVKKQVAASVPFEPSRLFENRKFETRAELDRSQIVVAPLKVRPRKALVVSVTPVRNVRANPVAAHVCAKHRDARIGTVSLRKVDAPAVKLAEANGGEPRHLTQEGRTATLV